MSKILFIDDSQKKSWMSTAGVLAFLLGCIFFLYRDTLLSMVEIWERSETFTHCFLVLPISLWLIWRKRFEILSHEPKPNFVALIFVLLFGLVWLFGNITATNSVSQLAFVGLVVSVVVLVLGVTVSRVIVFPLFFLFFAVPIGEFLLPVLMDGTANFTIFALRISGIPVYRDGLQFVIPSGNWSVVEACSGVRYLIASLTVGTLFAYLNYTSNKRRFIFVGISIVVPVFANWLRAYMIVLLGHISGNTIAVGVDHIIYGWLFFGIVIISMFMIGIRWAEVSPEQSNVVGRPIRNILIVKESRYTWLALAFGFLFLASPVIFSDKVNSVHNLNPVQLNLPQLLPQGWQLVANTGDVWKPVYIKPSAESIGVFDSTKGRVGVYLGYYRDQYFGRKLISSDNVLVSSQDAQWNAVYQEQMQLQLAEKLLKIKSTTLKHVNGVAGSSDRQMEVWRYYWINGHVTDSDYAAKIYSGVSKLLGSGDDAAVIVLHVERGLGVDSRAVLVQFLQDNYLQIDELLHAAREGRSAAVTTIGKT